MTTEDLKYSVRLLIPFARALRREPGVHPDLLAAIDSMDPDERIPISSVHELLRGAIVLTHDDDIGLKAAREVRLGDHGFVEYAARSASTWAEAAHVVARYLRLLNDALDFSVREDGEHAYIRLGSKVELPRAAADFQSGAFHTSAASLHRAVSSGLSPLDRTDTARVPQPSAEARRLV